MPQPSSHSTVRFPLFAGIDVGGTNIKLGIVDDQGHSLAHGSFSTDPQGSAEAALQLAREKLDSMLGTLGYNWDQIAAVGLGTPGPMDLRRGLILTPSNLPGWHNAPLVSLLSGITGKPVTLANDAGAAAFGEYWVGSGQHYESLVLLTLGTGVGGGIIIGGQSLDGFHSHGAELGHLLVDSASDGLMCGCGQRGHLEAYASATGLVERTRRLLGSAAGDRYRSSLVSRISDSSPLSALMIAEEADRGDPLALKLVMETAGYLGRGIADLAHVIDPAVFVLGGGMDFGGAASALGQKFIGEVADTARKLIFPVLRETLEVQFASLGGAAGYIGAAGLARHQFQNKLNN
jgi:glucokinase